MAAVRAGFPFDLNEIDFAAGRPRRRRVVTTAPHRHGLIVHAVHEQHFHRHRHQPDRVSDRVALRVFVRRAAHQPADRAAAGLAVRGLEIRDAGHRHDRPRCDLRPRARRPLGQRCAPGRPQRQVPTGRMAKQRHPPQVDRCVEIAQMVDRRRYVTERRRPAATPAAPNASVLDIPHRPAAPREIRADRPHHQLREPLRPRSSMDCDDHRVRPAAARQVQLSALTAQPFAVAMGTPRRDHVDS